MDREGIWRAYSLISERTGKQMRDVSAVISGDLKTKMEVNCIELN